MGPPKDFEGISLTAIEHKPAFVQQGHNIESPTVWYGSELAVEVRFNPAYRLLLHL